MPNRKTVLPNARQFPRFAGIPTFCRYPRLEDVEPQNRPVDWVLYGVPYDGGVTYRPGARFGPRAIRDASQYVKPHHLEHDVTITEVMSLADAGDAPTRPYSCRETQDAVCEWAEQLGEPSSTKLLAVGGDHSIALANMRATWRRRGSPDKGLALIHFDSHIDTVDEIWGETHQHGSVFRRAFEEGIVDPQRMLSIGVKGPLNRSDDLHYAIDRGVRVVTYADWEADGEARLQDYLSEIAADECYLTFDIDVVDPAFAPGTGTPSVGGFSSSGVFEALRMLAGVNLVGADVVEVLPDRDPSGITSLLAAHVIFEILSLDALRRTV